MQDVPYTIEIPKPDSVRQTFADMYEDILASATENKTLSAEEERQARVNAMVETAISIRRQMDPEYAMKLKSLETKKDFTQYLLAEYKLFGFVPKQYAARVFAEYMLMTMLDEFEADDKIDYDFLGEVLNRAFKEAPAEYRKTVTELRRVFKWGVLLDE